MASSRKRLLPDLPQRVEACLARYLLHPRLTRLCVGLSGGLDSVVLLHLLAGYCSRTGHSLQAIHVHHGLSPHADSWAEFACRYAASLGVECTVTRVVVNGREALGLEGAARLARYAVFEQQECDVLLLAQHRDDQAETLLLNLLRGSGVRGLAAMPECRMLDSGARLLRPLLDISRDDLLAYAQARGLAWVEDESNADVALSRNFLRHAVMPLLAGEFPGAAITLSRSAQHLAEADAVLLEVAQGDLQRCLVEDAAFCLDSAKALSVARFRNALRYWLQLSGIVADSRAFDELIRMMGEAALDAQPSWIWREHAVRRYRGRLYVTRSETLAGPVHEFTWQLGAVTPVSAWHGNLHWRRSEDEVGIAEDALSGRLMLRPRVGGESLRIAPGRPTRKLKHLYQEAAIPPWLRESLPLLWIDDRLAAVPGKWVAAEFAQKGGWRASWQDDLLGLRKK